MIVSVVIINCVTVKAWHNGWKKCQNFALLIIHYIQFMLYFIYYCLGCARHCSFLAILRTKIPQPTSIAVYLLSTYNLIHNHKYWWDVANLFGSLFPNLYIFLSSWHSNFFLQYSTLLIVHSCSCFQQLVLKLVDWILLQGSQ